ncbi:radical SAM protein [Acidobacteriia bacterium AH_259_A11_L15]|nr:radical SAM protein [Acidobacteriia bacterium AH_259_A11_L15]
MNPPKFVPRLVFWELTKGCNLRCIHCRATAQELASPLDLSTPGALKVIEQVSSYAHPILILSGGEPLFRKDLFQLASYAVERGLLVALATNGTLITPEVAARIRSSGIRRVAISFDGADAPTHDSFRGIPGAFEAGQRGLKNVQEVGLSTQINTTIARHNVHQLPQILEMALALGVDALHTFLLVPVGCGVNIADEQMVPAAEYEKILHWFYDREREGRLELKATCAPHYFRVRKQREVHERRAAQAQMDAPHPGTLGANLKPRAAHPSRLPGSRHPQMAAVTKGCLAGSAVCFISHQGEVYPCGYLPVKGGDLRRQTFAEIWENSPVFTALRDPDNLKGKCGLCEFRKICLGCRARAYAATGDFLSEEPFCIYEPGQSLWAPRRRMQSTANSFLAIDTTTPKKLL